MSELKVSNLRKEHGKEGPDLVGITTLTSQHYMVPPSGTTAERPENPEAGTLRYNTDSGNLEYFRGGQLGWETIHKKSYNLGGAATSGSIDGTGARAIFSGGYTPSVASSLDRIDFTYSGSEYHRIEESSMDSDGLVNKYTLWS